MSRITSVNSLRRAIVSLENRQLAEEQLLIEQFTATYESLKPINVIRKMFDDILTVSELKEPLIETLAGVLTGYLSKILIIRNSDNAFRRLIGVFVQYGVTNIVSKNLKIILKTVLNILQSFKDALVKDKE